MEIERVDVAGSPRIVGACYEILRTAQPVDDPDGPPISRRMFERWMEKSWNGDPQEMWVALGEGDDGVVGWYLLHLPATDNLHMASFNVTVRQDRLRQGLGTALLRHGAARALDERRSLIHSWARDGSRGEAFARSRGATGGIAQLRRVLELDAAAADRLGELRAAAESAATALSPGSRRPLRSTSTRWRRSTTRSPTRRTMRAGIRHRGTRSVSARPNAGPSVAESVCTPWRRGTRAAANSAG